MPEDLPLVILVALFLVTIFVSLTITEIAKERTKQECIRAGMVWQDDNCISVLDTGGDE
jgi:hypothetical protein